MDWSCYGRSLEELDSKLQKLAVQAQHTGRHIRLLYLNCSCIGEPQVALGRVAATVARRVPHLLDCFTPGRVQVLVLQPAALTEGMAAALQHLVPSLDSLAFGATECALPATRFCCLVSELAALKSLELAARHMAPSVLTAIAVLPGLTSLQLQSQAALPDTRQLSALTRLSLLELMQSEHAGAPLLVPSATALTQLTRVGFGASQMQASVVGDAWGCC